MNTGVIYAHIAKNPGICGGRPCIEGHRIRVQDIAVEHEWQALTPEEISHQHPGLTLAEVHAALTYYYDHREEILAEIEADRLRADDFQRRHPDSTR
jgi:uncharacterized protein (DUF433 family)